jgi:cell division FtsZ-interacting protein ZapD
VTGAAAAGMVNPEDAGTGAAIGGALPLATAGLRAAGSGLVNTFGAYTGTSGQTTGRAFSAGRIGSAEGRTFKEQARQEGNFLNVLDDTKSALDQMIKDRAAAYRSNMAAVQADKTVLDMTPIEQAVQESINKFTFKRQDKNPDVLNTLSRVRERVQNWRSLDPVEYHTPEGLDALKQQIGSIRESLPNEARSSRAALDNVYASIKRQIESQAPNYAKAMKDYEEASDLISEITRTFSLGDRATADTAMRKLQSVMRNNVQTNYGVRTSLLDQLEQYSGKPIGAALAGQALSDWFPRGFQRANVPVAAGLIGFGTGNFPLAAGIAAASSPRLVGEVLYGAGQASRFIEPLRRPLYSVAPVLGAQ